MVNDVSEKRGDDMESAVISRRQMLRDVGLIAGCAVLGSGLTLAATRRENDTSQDARTERPCFTEEDTGLVHCQTGALTVATQRMFDWLDENI
jgi:hypothetical protein